MPAKPATKPAPSGRPKPGRAPAPAVEWKFTRIGPEEYRATPILLPDEIPPKTAAKLLGLTLTTVYDFIKAGLLRKRQASPGKMLLGTKQVLEFKEATRAPNFWPKWLAANPGKIPSKLKKAPR